MKNHLEIRGDAGQLRWSYHVAALLGSWTLVDHVLTAKVLTSDALRVSQRPLTFLVPRPGRPWVWPLDSLQIADGTLTATVGPQERADHAPRPNA